MKQKKNTSNRVMRTDIVYRQCPTPPIGNADVCKFIPSQGREMSLLQVLLRALVSNPPPRGLDCYDVILWVEETMPVQLIYFNLETVVELHGFSSPARTDP